MGSTGCPSPGDGGAVWREPGARSHPPGPGSGVPGAPRGTDLLAGAGAGPALPGSLDGAARSRVPGGGSAGWMLIPSGRPDADPWEHSVPRPLVYVCVWGLFMGVSLPRFPCGHTFVERGEQVAMERCHITFGAHKAFFF